MNFGRVFRGRDLVLFLLTVCLVGAGVFLLSQKFGIGPNNEGIQVAQAQGPAEIIEKRQENSKTFDLGGNERQLLASIGAVHYKDNYDDQREVWKDIDLTWVGNRITKAPYELTLDGTKLALKNKKNGEVSTIELFDVKPPGMKWEIIPENTRVSFRHILPSDKVPFEATFKVTGKGLITTKAFDDDGELVLDSSQVGDVLTEKLSEIKDKQTGKVRPAKGLVRIDPTWQVAASTDDCYYQLSNDYFNTTNWFGAGYNSGGIYQLSSAARFLNITIPAGNIITSANLKLTCTLSEDGTTVKTRLRAEEKVNPITFSTKADFLARIWTTAYVHWDSIAAWVLDTPYTSLDFSSCIQEVIGLPGWASGNPIVVLWDDWENRSSSGLLIERRAYSYDGSTTKAPQLVITYTEAAAASTAPAGGGDHTPPTRYNTQPTGILVEGTTQTTISLTTDEPATCKYSTERFTPYYLMTNTFLTGGGISNLFPHSATVRGLISGNTYNYYVKCSDIKGNVTVDDFLISFSVADATPPVLSHGQPAETLDVETTQTNLSLITNESAVCRYSTIAGINYDSMPNTFSITGSISHSTPVKGLSSGNAYTYYVKCSDTSGNKNTDDFIISFSVAPAPTLFVTLSADLSSQASLSKYDLTVDVSGTAVGPISYYFYCNRSDSSTNINFNYNDEYFNIAETSKTAPYVCDYPTAGTYNAKVIVRRGQNLAESRIEITVMPEKTNYQMTLEGVQAKVAEIQQKINELFSQLAQVLEKQLARMGNFLASLWLNLIQ